ncbi:MAG: RICIN domain-containing protein [Acidobacteria bacterium]|nr:RICIN domain-containing protein [Acidobacteriota bacterium]
MDRLAKAFLLLAGSYSLLAVFPGRSLAQQSFSGPGRYRVEIVATGKALDLRMEDKKTVQQWAVGNARNQEWDFVDAGGGFYFITSAENSKVLDVDGGRARNGAFVITATRGSGDNQMWKISDNGRAEFTIISKAGKSLESPAGKQTDGVKLQIGEPHGLENQRFRLVRLGDVPSKVRPREDSPATTPGTTATSVFTGKGRYQIQSVVSGHFLDLRRDDNSTLQQWSGSRAPNQQWDFEDAGNGYFYIRSVESGRILEVTGSRDGSAVIAKGQQVGRDNQKFRVVDVGNGQSMIVAKNGKVLDLPNGARAEGQSLQVWGEHRRDNQRFVFKPVETTVILSGGRTREARGSGIPSRGDSTTEQPYSPGKLVWRGRVDTEIMLEIRGNSVTEKLVTGKSFNNGRFTFSSPMPARQLSLRIEKKKARGSVELVENPSQANGYMAVLRIRDAQRDAADYEFELIW